MNQDKGNGLLIRRCKKLVKEFKKYRKYSKFGKYGELNPKYLSKIKKFASGKNKNANMMQKTNNIARQHLYLQHKCLNLISTFNVSTGKYMYMLLII